MAAIDTARSVFDSFDLDKDGYLTAEELRKVLSEVGSDISAEQAQALLERPDTDGDGRVSFDEFWTAYQNSEH